jgi:hypothetical protein
MATKSKSAKFYQNNPAARKVKAATDKKINARPEQIKKRTSLNKYNRDHGTYGNGDKKDAAHRGNKIVGFQSQSKNRGSKTASMGDRNARGKKKC